MVMRVKDLKYNEAVVWFDNCLKRLIIVFLSKLIAFENNFHGSKGMFSFYEKTLLPGSLKAHPQLRVKGSFIVENRNYSVELVSALWNN